MSATSAANCIDDVEKWLAIHKEKQFYCERTQCYMTKEACLKRQELAKKGRNFSQYDQIYIDSCYGCPQGNVETQHDKLKEKIIKFLRTQNGFTSRLTIAKKMWGRDYPSVYKAIEKLIEEGRLDIQPYTERSVKKYMVKLK